MHARLTIAGTIVAGAATVVLAAPAAAAPAGSRDVDDTVVMQLQRAGNTVIVNRTGNHELLQCTVTGVRPGHTYSRYDSGYPGAQMDPMSQVVGMTVYVDALC
jgi:hypothetical protein